MLRQTATWRLRERLLRLTPLVKLYRFGRRSGSRERHARTAVGAGGPAPRNPPKETAARLPGGHETLEEKARQMEAEGGFLGVPVEEFETRGPAAARRLVAARAATGLQAARHRLRLPARRLLAHPLPGAGMLLRDRAAERSAAARTGPSLRVRGAGRKAASLRLTIRNSTPRSSGNGSISSWPARSGRTPPNLKSPACSMPSCGTPIRRRSS